MAQRHTSSRGRPAFLLCWTIALVGFFLCLTMGAAGQTFGVSCRPPEALRDDAFQAPMTFSSATSKGNMSTSSWIAATGEIRPETPDQFRAFLAFEKPQPGQIVLHSPGGNLAAGLELGRLIRETGLSTHVGKTERAYDSFNAPCDTWFDSVDPGVCASSCAYAFLGGKERFLDSPYYPTDGSLLGFHQFYGHSELEADMLTAEEVGEIEATTLSVAQAVTGQIVLYAIDMGIDPRIVAFASATPSEALYYPDEAEMVHLSIASGSGLQPWFMEPYGEGLLTTSKPHRSDSMLKQVTAFCPKTSGEASFLITMDLTTPSYPDPNDLPLNAVNITIDNDLFSFPRSRITIRYANRSILVTVPVGQLRGKLLGAERIELSLDAARVMGGFREGNDLDQTARQSLALAWRNCI